MRLARVAVALAAVASTGWLASAPAEAANTSSHSPSAAAVHGVDVAHLTVLYNGKELTADEAAGLAATAEAAKRPFIQVYDPASSRAGIAHAFDSPAEADAFAEANRSAMVAAGAAAVPQQFRTMGTLPTTCLPTTHQSKMYDGANCTGGYFSFFRVDDEPNLATYGWANKGNSIVVGGSDCLILVRLYPAANYTYTEARFYGSGGSSSEYYAFNSAQYNNFESGRSTCS